MVWPGRELICTWGVYQRGAAGAGAGAFSGNKTLGERVLPQSGKAVR